MSETIKSLANLLSAVKGLNEDSRNLEQYAAKKMIDMKLESELYDKKRADKLIDDTVGSYTLAETDVLTGQNAGTLQTTGDTKRTINKKDVGTSIFASIFSGGILGGMGLSTSTIEGRIKRRRFGKKQIDSVGTALSTYGNVINEARKAETNNVDIQKNPEIVRQFKVYRDILNEVNVKDLPDSYKETYIGQQSLISTYLGE